MCPPSFLIFIGLNSYLNVITVPLYLLRRHERTKLNRRLRVLLNDLELLLQMHMLDK